MEDGFVETGEDMDDCVRTKCLKGVVSKRNLEDVRVIVNIQD
jgi:hypothetical protein